MKQNNILGSVKIVILTLIFVKLIGFIKQAVIAAYFGTSGSIDKFLLVSEFMENMGAAIFSAISISFLTIYVDVYEKDGRIGTNRLTSNTFAFFLPIIIILIASLLLFSEQVAHIIAPGFDENEIQLISGYIMVFSITMISMFIYYVCNAVLEAEKVFFPGKIVGVMRSVAVISSIVVLSGKLGINAMLVGVIVYYICETIFIIICIRKKFSFKPTKPFNDLQVRSLLKLSIPLFISYGVVQIQGAVDKAIASGLPEGSISALSYSGYLYNTTHSILVGGLCTVIFSYFSTYIAERNEHLLLETLYKYIKILVIVLAFVSVLFIGYAYDIVSIVYERGAFGAESVKGVAMAFGAYSIGLVFIGIRDIMIRAHYAYQNNKQAMINGIIGLVINIIMSIILSKQFNFVGIAFATSIASFCISVISCQTIKKNINEFKISALSRFFAKIICACAATLVSIYFLNTYFDFGITLIDLMIKAICSFIIYIITLWLLKCGEMDSIKIMFLEKFRSKRR